ncbi:helix-turn-helix domain-containing protein [Clostridium sp. JNZ J1-5]
MNIGKNIHELRKKANMTQQDLADSLGISRSAISRIESKSSLDTDLLEKISKALNVSLISLIYENENDVSTEIAASITPLPKSIRELHNNNIETYRKLPDKTKNFVRAMGIEIYNEILDFQCKAIEKFSKNLQLELQYIFDNNSETLKTSCIDFIDTYTTNWISHTLKERGY